MKSSFLLGIIVTAFILTFIGADRSDASPSITLKLSHHWANGDLRDKWAHTFTQKIEERTNGAIKFEIYPAGVLFKPNAQFDALRAGALDAAVLPPFYASGKVPQMLVVAMPCLVRNYELGMKWRDAEIGKMIDKIFENNGSKILSWGFAMHLLGSKKKPILLPTDAKGLKMRGPSKCDEEMFRAAGASITSMPSSEAYFALQSGALDAVATAYSTFLSFHFYEVLDYLLVGGTHNNFSSALTCVMISNKTLARLSPEQKDLVVATGREIEKWYNEETQKEDQRALEFFSQKGLKIHYMKDEEFTAWAEIAKKSAWKAIENVKGGKELLDAALSVK